ncbi:MAG: helix-turn-helix transcriptional regulator [Candidatus Methanofastidiosia archaeon]
MMQKCTFSLFVFLLFIFITPVAADTTIEVYRDGYVHIEHDFITEELQSVIEVRILSSSAENLYVLDEGGNILKYEKTDNLLIIYSLGKTIIKISYDTSALTSKNGATWTFESDFPENTEIALPDGSTVLYLSTTPIEINLEDNTFIFEAGHCEISYFFGVEKYRNNLKNIILGIAVVAFGIAGVFISIAYKRRKEQWFEKEDLDPLERKVLHYIWEHEEVLESEIRDKFDMPKTSSWRLMRRLEQRCYINVKRKNRLNFISIRKKS